MTALAPYYVEASQSNGVTAMPSAGGATLTAVGAQAGDLLVVVQTGTQVAGTRVAPTVAAGGNMALQAVEANGNTNGRVAIYSIVLVSGDLSAGITINNATFANSRTHIYLVRAAEGFIASGAAGGHRAEIIQSHANVADGTAFSWTVTPTYRSIVIAAFAKDTANVDTQTISYDSGTARDPYCDESTSTTTTGAHGSHFGLNHNYSCSDWNGYDSTDTPTNFAWQARMANTTHAFVAVLFQSILQHVANVASEIDTAQPVVPSKSIALGVATETDSALVAVLLTGTLVGVADETDLAVTLTSVKTITVGVAAETDTATNLRQMIVAAGTTAETDTALPLGIVKSWSAEVAIADPTGAERITDIELTASKRYTTDTGDIRIALKQGSSFLQTSDWVALTDTPTVVPLTIDTPPAGSDFRIWWEVRTSTQLDPVISDVSATVLFVIGVAEEDDSALPVPQAPKQSFALTRALEVDTAVSVARTKTKPVGVAAETDSASTITQTTTSSGRMLVFFT